MDESIDSTILWEPFDNIFSPNDNLTSQGYGSENNTTYTQIDHAISIMPNQTTNHLPNSLNTFNGEFETAFEQLGDSTPTYPIQNSIRNPMEYETLNGTNLNSDDIQQMAESSQIEIIAQPRNKFKPRTEKEMRNVSHYIHSDSSEHPYPTIKTKSEWSGEVNLIEVSLVDIAGNVHPYTIDGKGNNHDQKIVKIPENPKSVYYPVTEQEIKNGYKTFYIKHIKSKQDDYITKQFIEDRQLYSSMLRFTRYFQCGATESEYTYTKDESSIVYSTIMTEDYGTFTITDVYPLYGPMLGNTKVCIETKGHIQRDAVKNIDIYLCGKNLNLKIPASSIKTTAKSFSVVMPPYLFAGEQKSDVKMIIQWHQQTIAERTYTYLRLLDEIVTGNANMSMRQHTCLQTVDSFICNNVSQNSISTTRKRKVIRTKRLP